MKRNKAMLMCAALLATVIGTQGCMALALSSGSKGPTKKAPAQTATSCKEWECWDGYKCGECPQETQSEPKKN